MREHLSSALQLQSVEAYENLKASWQSVSSSATALFSSVAKVASDVAEHVKTRAREAKRQETRKSQQEKQAALKAIRDQAKSAADEIRSRVKPVVQDPVFLIENLKDVTLPAKEVKGVGEIPGWVQPWFIKDWQPGMDCLNDAALKKSLDTFAAQYRKLGDPSGRHQYNFNSAQAMVDSMFKQVTPPSVLDLEADEIPNGGKFMGAKWFYGFDPGMNFLGLLPNGASQIRIHARGEVNITMFSVHQFVEKILRVNNDACPYTKALALVQKWTDKDVETARNSNGLTIYHHKLVANEVLFIPDGFLCIETCDPGSSEVYGMRKSFFCIEPESLQNYRAVVELFKNDGREVGQMEAVEQSLDKHVAAAAKKQPAVSPGAKKAGPATQP
ncbi:unnamed protein product [Durusdinium trenchii]|uniref:Uncharacterized protein n=1 Tax=Durusdinium trenchii TaxID=1381693 RepID=A0ABP0NP44_9DINO